VLARQGREGVENRRLPSSETGERRLRGLSRTTFFRASRGREGPHGAQGFLARRGREGFEIAGIVPGYPWRGRGRQARR
jgi:hypothetical protein